MGYACEKNMSFGDAPLRFRVNNSSAGVNIKNFPQQYDRLPPYTKMSDKRDRAVKGGLEQTKPDTRTGKEKHFCGEKWLT